ncbi:MAG TPA: ABC transporter substrate-binding protein [Stellaceae bacterium]
MTTILPGRSWNASLLGAVLVLALRWQPAVADDAIKIGVVKNSVYGPFFVAESRGYFTDEKLAAELVYFDSTLTMGPAVASGSIDFAGGNASAAIYNLGAHGAVRVIAGFAEDAPGFQLFAFVASNRAYQAGLKSFAALPGHSVAIQTRGGAAGYTLNLIEAKYHLDPSSVRELSLQSNSNMISAVTGGTADSFIGPATPIMPVVKRGGAKLIGFTGDEVQWQLGTIYTAKKTADERHDVVARFLAAYRKGVHDYDDAFVDAGGTRRDSADAPAILEILSKHLGQTPAALKPALGYVNAEGRLDVTDIRRQIAWYKSQGMIKPDADAQATIDQRYVLSLPEK